MNTQDKLDEFQRAFPDEIYRDKLGSYPDHAPAYTHDGDGECTCCPVQCWVYDDMYNFFSRQEQRHKEEMREVKSTLACPECCGSGVRSTPSDYSPCSQCDGTGFDSSNGSLNDVFTHIINKKLETI